MGFRRTPGLKVNNLRPDFINKRLICPIGYCATSTYTMARVALHVLSWLMSAYVFFVRINRFVKNALYRMAVI